jgi:hypothetical protein
MSDDNGLIIHYTPAGLEMVFNALAEAVNRESDPKQAAELKRHLKYMAGRWPEELKDSIHLATYLPAPVKAP